MRIFLQPVGSFLSGLLLLSLTASSGVFAAEKEVRPRGNFTSPDGHYRVVLTVHSGEQSAAIADAKTGAELLPLSSAGSPWITEGSHVLWSPDSQRLAFVTPTRRGASTDICFLHDGKWELADFPGLPHFRCRGHREESKTILASVAALRWLKPNQLQLENKVEDDEGKSASIVFMITFDAENHMAVKAAR